VEQRTQQPGPGDISELVRRWAEGRPGALDELFLRTYRELRRVARQQMRRERPHHSLQITALVNEAYLRLVEQRGGRAADRAEFFAAAAGTMRRILVDHARARGRQKRAGGAVRVPFDETTIVAPQRDASLVALDEALDDLERYDRRKASVVELRYFGGLTVEEAAQVLDLSPITVKRDWAFARAWLHRRMRHHDADRSGGGRNTT